MSTDGEEILEQDHQEEESEPQPGAWRDRAGFLWLESSPGRVFCYDDSVRRRMGDRWPSQPFPEAAAEFGPLVPLVPREEGEEDRIVFLYGGGSSSEVPSSHPTVAGRKVPEEAFAEVIPGYAVALLSHGWYFVNEHECLEGTFVIIRRIR